MIGVCKVPLKSLIAGCSSHDKYPIITPGSASHSGSLEVKISVIDVDRVPNESFNRAVESATELHYGKEWEEDLILRIARPLAKYNMP